MTTVHWQEAEVKPIIELLARRWVLAIVKELWRGDAVRRVDLRRRLGSISDKSLTAALHELESAGFVSRAFYEEVPPRVEYSLTEYGRSLEPLLAAATAWTMNGNFA